MADTQSFKGLLHTGEAEGQGKSRTASHPVLSHMLKTPWSPASLPDMHLRGCNPCRAPPQTAHLPHLKQGYGSTWSLSSSLYQVTQQQSPACQVQHLHSHGTPADSTCGLPPWHHSIPTGHWHHPLAPASGHFDSPCNRGGHSNKPATHEASACFWVTCRSSQAPNCNRTSCVRSKCAIKTSWQDQP